MSFSRMYFWRELFSFSHWPKSPFPQFAREAVRAGFHAWSPGDPVEPSGTRLLIGAATWSGYDRKFLDEISSSLRQIHPSVSVCVDVFPLDVVHDAEALLRYFPTASPASQEPMAEVWRDGQFQEFAAGHLAMELVRRTLAELPKQ